MRNTLISLYDNRPVGEHHLPMKSFNITHNAQAVLTIGSNLVTWQHLFINVW